MELLLEFTRSLLKSEDAMDVTHGVILSGQLGKVAFKLLPDLLAAFNKWHKQLDNMNLWCHTIGSVVRTADDNEEISLLRSIKHSLDTLVALTVVQAQGMVVEEEKEKLEDKYEDQEAYLQSEKAPKIPPIAPFLKH